MGIKSNKRAAVFLLVSAILFPVGAFADFFWVVPSGFNLKSPGGFFVGLGAGHDFPRSTEFRARPKNLPSNGGDFSRYVRVDPNGETRNLRLRKEMPVEYGNLVLGPVKLGAEGTILLAIDTKIRYSTRVLGKDWEDIPKDRVEKGKRILASFAFSSYGKTIVHRGSPGGNGFKTNIGQDLEIIPLKDPANVKVGEYFKLKILYKGKSVSKERVVYQIAKDKKRIVQGVTLTSSKGIARIKISSSGKYLIEIDHAEINPKWPDCNERRLHSSITFFIL